MKALSVEQLKSIWAPGSKIKMWKHIDPAWPVRNIILYSPDNDSGTFEFFTDAIVGKSKSQRDDVQQSSDDNTLVNGVAGDRGRLGLFRLRLLCEQHRISSGRSPFRMVPAPHAFCRARPPSPTSLTLRCRGRCTST